MKVLLSATDVAAILATHWNLDEDDVALSGVEEVAVEIPATLLGVTTPAKPKQTRKRKTAKAADPTPKEKQEADLEDELGVLAEETSKVDSDKEGVDVFIDDDPEDDIC